MNREINTDRRARGPLFGALAAAVLLLFLAACAPRTDLTAPPGLGTRVLDDVPFHPQREYQCGPSVLASLLGHAGDPVSPDEIARDVFRDDLRGTLTLDMGLYPRRRGHQSTFGKGSPQRLVNEIDEGRPVGVMVNLGFDSVRRLHFMTVVGYTPDAVVAHNAETRAEHIPWNDFLPLWDSAGRWMLTVTPKEQ